MSDEYLTVEQMLDELCAVASKPVADAVRKRYPMDGVLPLHAIRQDLGLAPVTMFKRIAEPRLKPKPHPTPEGGA